MSNDKIVMYDSDEAAHKEMCEVWVSRRNRVYVSEYPNDPAAVAHAEECARSDGATHQKCQKCGIVYPRHELRLYELCRECLAKHESANRAANYAKLVRVSWDGRTPLALHWQDKWFFSASDIREYLEEPGEKLESLQLVLCEPQRVEKLDVMTLCEDILPDGEDAPGELIDAVEALNKVIATLPPVSWIGTDTAAVVTSEQVFGGEQA